MYDLLRIAQENSKNAVKTKEDYAKTVFETIDNIILDASKYENVTGIFLAQVVTKVFQVMYRETNSPLDREYEYTHGSSINLLSIDDNSLRMEEIVDHYAKLGFLAGIKVFVFRDSIQYRILISWSDEELTEDKVNIHKYVDGKDIFEDDSHPEDY